MYSNLKSVGWLVDCFNFGKLKFEIATSFQSEVILLYIKLLQQSVLRY